MQAFAQDWPLLPFLQVLRVPAVPQFYQLHVSGMTVDARKFISTPSYERPAQAKGVPDLIV
jgi:hypothetical protein